MERASIPASRRSRGWSGVLATSRFGPRSTRRKRGWMLSGASRETRCSSPPPESSAALRCMGVLAGPGGYTEQVDRLPAAGHLLGGDGAAQRAAPLAHHRPERVAPLPPPLIVRGAPVPVGSWL